MKNSVSWMKERTRTRYENSTNFLRTQRKIVRHSGLSLSLERIDVDNRENTGCHSEISIANVKRDTCAQKRRWFSKQMDETRVKSRKISLNGRVSGNLQRDANLYFL